MKTFKRILLVFIAICLLPLDVLAMEGDAAISVNGNIASPGETVEVTIELENNPGLASAKLLVEYDMDILTLQAVEDTGVLGTQVHKPELVSPYILTWANDTVTENYTHNGTIVTLHFLVAEDAPEGDTSITVSYDYDNYDIIDWEMNKVWFNVSDGIVKVGQTPPTDISLLTYSLSGNEMTITGYTGEEIKLVIGSYYEVDGIEYVVTAIDEEAFAENALIETVIIPSSVEAIGDYAFYLCENLKAVTFSDGLKTIGADAFDGCCSLTEVILPKSLEILGEYAFYDCTLLKAVSILNPETEIGDIALGYYYISRREDGIVEGFTIKGNRNSTAQTYAQENEVVFVDIFAFKGAALILQDNLAINYKVDRVLFEGVGYTDPYIVFEMNGETTIVDTYTVDGDRYVFKFTNIAPNQMTNTIYATLYATYDGIEYVSATREYSVAEYCYSMLELHAADKYAELRTLLVDLLHYGGQSQLYTNYNTSNLVDAKLTDEQRLWGTSDAPILHNVLNTAYQTVENPTVKWKGAGLILNDSITMRFKLVADDVEGLSVKIKSATNEWIIPSEKFIEKDGMYYVYFNSLNAGQMSENVYLTVYDSDVRVSNTVCYSIESYAYEKQNSTIEHLSDLVMTMMKYGKSAYAYVN